MISSDIGIMSGFRAVFVAANRTIPSHEIYAVRIVLALNLEFPEFAVEMAHVGPSPTGTEYSEQLELGEDLGEVVRV